MDTNNRKQTNLEILNKLNEYILANPEQRFGQILRNLGIIQEEKWIAQSPEVFWINGFYEESIDTLERINNTILKDIEIKVQKIVERQLDIFLTERTLKNFKEVSSKFAEFINVSQFVNPQPTHISEIKGNLMGEPNLYTGHFLYGVETDGSLIWLGSITDSSG